VDRKQFHTSRHKAGIFREPWADVEFLFKPALRQLASMVEEALLDT
jgi:hypothetical protein